MQGFRHEGNKGQESQEQDLFFRSADGAERAQIRSRFFPAVGDKSAQLLAAEKMQDGEGDEGVDKLERQIFRQKLQPGERYSHVFDHDEAGQTDVVGKKGGP